MLSGQTPNNSFKPNPLRHNNQVAGRFAMWLAPLCGSVQSAGGSNTTSCVEATGIVS